MIPIKLRRIQIRVKGRRSLQSQGTGSLAGFRSNAPETCADSASGNSDAEVVGKRGFWSHPVIFCAFAIDECMRCCLPSPGTGLPSESPRNNGTCDIIPRGLYTVHKKAAKGKYTFQLRIKKGNTARSRKEGDTMQISYTFHISSKNNAITTVKKLSTASKHNMRKYSSPGNQTGHYDSGKIVQLAGTDNLFRDVEKVYHEQFDQALADYNKKQKRTDRKILDYMRYVSENGKSDLAVEAIIQLGDREFWENIPELQKRQMTYIFKDQLNALRQHLPEFVVANAVIHFDESSPHMHVIGVPVSSGYKRGLSKQCAKTRVFTKDSLEKLQNVLRRRALKGMEKNPEIFSNSSLKSKEAGRNSDYSKE